MNQNQNNQNQPQLREVNANSNNPRWEPHKMNFDPANPPRLAGYYKDENERPGKNGSFTVLEIHTVNPDGTLGPVVDVSASTVLEDKMAQIPMGSFIVIEFGGKVTPKGGGNPYNIWKVFVDDNAIPYDKIGGFMGTKNAPRTQQQNNNQQQFNQNGGGNNNQQQFGGQNQFSGNNTQQNQQFGGQNQFNQGNNNQFNQQQNGNTFQQNGSGQNPQQNNQQFNQNQNFNQNNQQQNNNQQNGNGFKQYQGGDLPF